MNGHGSATPGVEVEMSGKIIEAVITFKYQDNNFSGSGSPQVGGLEIFLCYEE